VHVVGSINMDFIAVTRSLPLPGETAFGSDFRRLPGGKGANQAVAAIKGGVATSMVGCVGGDDLGVALRRFLESNGVGIAKVRTISRAVSGAALIIVDEAGENQIVIVSGANGHVETGDLAEIEVQRGDVVLCQFEIPTAVVLAALREARDRGAIGILNPAPAIEVSPELFGLADIVVLNEVELSTLSRSKISQQSDSEHVLQALERFSVSAPDATIILTSGSRGGVVRSRNHIFSYSARGVQAVDTAGAGDCFVGSFDASLAVDPDLRNAVEYANAAASLCVQRQGAGPSMPARSEVLAVLDDQRTGAHGYQRSEVV
jgi:ribokinase